MSEDESKKCRQKSVSGKSFELSSIFVLFFTQKIQILASFTNGSLTNIWQSTSKEINKRIKHAIEVRSSDRMHREHITTLTLVFKDSHIEEKVSQRLCRSIV